MSEGFTVFHNQYGTGVLVYVVEGSPLRGQTFNPSMTGQIEDANAITDRYMAYLTDMVSSGQWEVNSKSAISLPKYKRPKTGGQWTFGVDDPFIITHIKPRTSQDGQEMVIDFFSDRKENAYAVCSLTGDFMEQVPFTDLPVKGIRGEWYLTVDVGELKTRKDKEGNVMDEPYDGKYPNQFKLWLVSFVPVGGEGQSPATPEQPAKPVRTKPARTQPLAPQELRTAFDKKVELLKADSALVTADHIATIQDHLVRVTELSQEEITWFVDFMCDQEPLNKFTAFALWQLAQVDPQILMTEIVNYLAWDGSY
jgi:hypothetical protein